MIDSKICTEMWFFLALLISPFLLESSPNFVNNDDGNSKLEGVEFAFGFHGNKYKVPRDIVVDCTGTIIRKIDDLKIRFQIHILSQFKQNLSFNSENNDVWLKLYRNPFENFRIQVEFRREK